MVAAGSAPAVCSNDNRTRMARLLVASRPGRCCARGRATRTGSHAERDEVLGLPAQRKAAYHARNILQDAPHVFKFISTGPIGALALRQCPGIPPGHSRLLHAL